MKKRLFSILTIMLVVVLAFFAFTACNKTLDSASSNKAGLSFEIILVIFTAFLFVFAYYMLSKLYARNDVFVNFDGSASNEKAESLTYTKKSSKQGAKSKSGAFFKNTFVILAGLLVLTLFARLVLVLTTYGVGAKTTSMLAYASVLKEQGIANFVEYYSGAVRLSPGTLYILSIIGATGLSQESASILMRFVNVIADMVTVSLIYFYGKKYVGNRLSALFACIYGVLPVSMYFGGMHFAFESVLVALLLASVIMLVEKKFLTTYLLMSLAVVLDVRAMLLVPIALTYMGYMYYRDAQSPKRFTANRAKIVFGLVGMFALVYVLTLPIAIHQIAAGDAFFNFKYMASKIMSNNSFVDNAFNLYAMVGMNGKTFTNSAVTYLNVAFVVVLEVFAASMYFKNRNRQEILLIVSFVFAVTAVFTLKTDWTYIFLAIVFALVYAMVSGEKRAYIVVSGYSILAFLNVAQLLFSNGMFANETNMYLLGFDSKDAFLITFSVLSVLLTAYFVYVVYSITTNGKIVDIKGIEGSFKDRLKKLFARKKKADK